MIRISAADGRQRVTTLPAHERVTDCPDRRQLGVSRRNANFYKILPTGQ